MPSASEGTPNTPTAPNSANSSPGTHQARHAILLSGTPALSRPRELWAQLCALRPDIFEAGSREAYRQYARRYCGAYEDPETGVFEDSRSSNLDELNVLLQGLMLRRLKANVLGQLPSKVRQEVEIEPDASLVERLRDGLAGLEDLDEKIAAATEERPDSPDPPPR